MCGVAGYVGVPSKNRLPLVVGFGAGIDERGGHAAGFVSLSDRVHYARRVGPWMMAKYRFLRRAAGGRICMMHARYATSGSPILVTNAHPYAIRRDGRTILWGCHNGMLTGTQGSARRHNRTHTVDSRELFELLADNLIPEINDLDGYGVITWMKPGEDRIYLARISEHSDLYVAALKDGGHVYGSTEKIVKEACGLAELKIAHPWKCDEVGRVYYLSPEGVFATEQTGVRLSDTAAQGWYERVMKDYFETLEEEAQGELEKMDENEWEQQEWERWMNQP